MEQPEVTYFNSQIHTEDQTQVPLNMMKQNILPLSHKDQYMLLPDPAESTHTYLSNDLGVKFITRSSSAWSYNKEMKQQHEAGKFIYTCSTISMNELSK